MFYVPIFWIWNEAFTGAKIPLQRVIRPKINAPHLNVYFFLVKARKYLKVYPDTRHQDQYFGG